MLVRNSQRRLFYYFSIFCMGAKYLVKLPPLFRACQKPTVVAIPLLVYSAQPSP